MFEQYHSCISAQYMPVWEGGGGGGGPGELHLLLMQPPVSNAYDIKLNMSFWGGRGCAIGLKIPKFIVFKVR